MLPVEKQGEEVTMDQAWLCSALIVLHVSFLVGLGTIAYLLSLSQEEQCSLRQHPPTVLEHDLHRVLPSSALVSYQ